MQAIVNQGGDSSFYRDVTHVTSGSAVGDVTATISNASKFSPPPQPPTYRHRYQEQHPNSVSAAAADMILRHHQPADTREYFQSRRIPEKDGDSLSDAAEITGNTRTEYGLRDPETRRRQDETAAGSDTTSSSGLFTLESAVQTTKDVQSGDLRRMWNETGSVVDSRTDELQVGYPVERRWPVSTDVTDARWRHASPSRKHAKTQPTSGQRCRTSPAAARNKPEMAGQSETDVVMFPAPTVGKSSMSNATQVPYNNWFPCPLNVQRVGRTTASPTSGTSTSGSPGGIRLTIGKILT